jgi:hypothetical protein
VPKSKDIFTDPYDDVIIENPIDDSQYYRGDKNVPKEDAQFEWTPKMVKELKKCKENIIHFAENHFWIVNLDRGKMKIELYKAQKKALKSLADNRFVCVLASRQCGKALALDTPILTKDGWSTMGQLKDGDTIYGSNGQFVRVLKAHEPLYNRNCYEVVFDNGEKIVADEEHLWFTQTRKDRHKKDTGSVKTTKEILDTLLTHGGEPNHRIPMSMTGVESEIKDLPIEPYILGFWLGDGTTDTGTITVGDRDLPEIINLLNESVQFDQITCKRYKQQSTFVNITCSEKKRSKSLISILKENNLHKNKHIPEIYFQSSREQRLELLKGLMDSDGYIDSRGYANFYNTNLELVKQVRELVESLGYKVTDKKFIPKLNGVECSECGIVIFKPRELVCKLSFKTKRIKVEPQINNSKKRTHYHYIKKITPVKSVPVRCITVNSEDSLYLAGKQLIPTHNTTITTIYALWNTCFFDDQRVIIVANKENTAINIFKRIRMAYELLPNYLKPGVKEYGKTGVTFANGSSIGISTTTSTAARGDTASILCIDEAAFIDPHFMEEFWKSVIPIVSSGKKTKIFMVSTPNGTGNKFYEIYSGAEKETNGWHAERIDWWDVPGRGEKWRKQMVAALGSDEAFQQEFGNTFLDAGNSAVGASVIERYKENKKPVIWRGEGDAYRVFELPDPSKLYVVGVDVGEGIGRASSVAQVLDVTDLTEIKQVAVYGTNVVEPYHYANKLVCLAGQWGNPPLLVERNNCGGQVIDALFHKHMYERIVSCSKLANTGSFSNTRHLGILSHNNLRFAGVANMRYWVNFLQTVYINDMDTIKELETFIRYPNGTYRKKNDNFYDDRVMSLVWALFALEPEICEQIFQVEQYDDQNKPLKILDNGFYEIQKELYGVKELNNLDTSTGLMTNESEKYEPLISQRELEKMHDNSDYWDLMDGGWKPL